MSWPIGIPGRPSGASAADIFWGYDFVTGALMHALGTTGRIDRLSDGVCQSKDFEAVKKRMARFMAAGFIAICGKPDRCHAGKKPPTA